MNLPNLRPPDVRTEKGAIRWNVLDPWVRHCAAFPGGLRALSSLLCVGHSTLVGRANLLECEIAPVGRPSTSLPTQRELEVFDTVQRTGSQAQAALDLGLDKSTVCRVVRLVRDKVTDGVYPEGKRRCALCDGYGVTPASQEHPKDRGHHVCEACCGDGYVT